MISTSNFYPTCHPQAFTEHTDRTTGVRSYQNAISNAHAGWILIMPRYLLKKHISVRERVPEWAAPMTLESLQRLAQHAAYLLVCYLLIKLIEL